MRKHILKLNLVLSGLLIGATASAKPVAFKDWTFDDLGTSCVASTKKVVGPQTYVFQLSIDKSGLSPAEAWIRETPQSASKAFRLTTEVKPLESFSFAALRDTAGLLSYWGLPGNNASLISYVKRQTRLVVNALDANGTAKRIEFSLRGSSDAVDTLASKCAPGKALTMAFEQSFASPVTASADALKLDEAKTAELRTIYFTALQLNAAKGNLQKQSALLQAQYAKHLQELTSVTGNLDNLTKKELISLQTKKSEIEQQLANLDIRVADLQYAISQKESEISIANAAYDTAYRAIAPHIPERTRLSDALSTSKRDLQNSQNRLNDLERSITNARNTIASRESEVASLRSQLNQVQNDVYRAQSDYQNTDNILRRFQPGREREDRVRNHPVTRYCYQNRINICDRLIRSVENEADSEVSSVRNRLSADFSWAQNNLTNSQNLASQIDSKIRNYVDYEIPSLRSQISDLTAQRPSLENSVIRFRDDVSAKQAALQSFEQRVGYAQLQADLDAKSAKVVALRNELANLDKEKINAEKSRTQKGQELVSTDARIQDVLKRIASSQERTSELNKILEPYFAEKSRLEQEILNTEDQIQAKRQEFVQGLTFIKIN